MMLITHSASAQANKHCKAIYINKEKKEKKEKKQ